VLHQSLNLLPYEGLILQVDLSNLFFFFFQNHIIHTIGVLLYKFELLRQHCFEDGFGEVMNVTGFDKHLASCILLLLLLFLLVLLDCLV
jgi:hypothetical protein